MNMTTLTKNSGHLKITLLILIFLFPVSANASYILSDLDFWYYERLENEELRGGRSIQLNTRPMAIPIKAKEIELWNSSLFLRGLNLEYSGSSTLPFGDNREGDYITKGKNGKISGEFGITSDWFTLFLNPMISYHQNSSTEEHQAGVFLPNSNQIVRRFPEETEQYTNTAFHSGYMLLPIANWYLFLGREGMRLGAGKHDTLHFSNTIEPFPMVRVGTLAPFDTFLGYFSFLTFLGELEKDRAVPNTRFSGIRMGLSTEKRWEFGVSRSWTAGGENQNNGFSHVYWDHYTEFFKPNSGDEQYTDFRNQQLVFDFRLKIPEISLVFYGEWGREDHEHNWRNSIKNWGSSQAYLVGFKQIDLLAPGFFWLMERADTTQPTKYDASAVWYNHSEYLNGWSYKRQGIGHHMGSDASDLLLAFGMERQEYSFMLYMDYEVHGVRTSAADNQEKRVQTGVNAFWKANENLFLDFWLQQTMYRNFGQVSGNSVNSQEYAFGIRYKY